MHAHHVARDLCVTASASAASATSCNVAYDHNDTAAIAATTTITSTVAIHLDRGATACDSAAIATRAARDDELGSDGGGRVAPFALEQVVRSIRNPSVVIDGW